LVIPLVFISCNSKEKYDTGHFPEAVTNFSAVNSVYDDYNSTLPWVYYKHLFHFSSNRNSQGEDFDIIGENMFIKWDETDGSLEIDTDIHDNNYEYLLPMFDSLNTSCNELGPYSMGYRQEFIYGDPWENLVMYANDCSGNYDIKFIFTESRFVEDTTIRALSEVYETDFLNSTANDLYPSFFGNDFFFHDIWGLDVNKIEKVLFCSDREGNYDIYEAGLPADTSLIASLQSDLQLEPVKLAISSNANDKCPFVNGQLLVFASDRPGGFGGYDLYYSKHINETWSSPVNFGDHINTPFDEYRPITLHYEGFDNNLMIFSSDRPGGQGGFDLYYAGIEQMIR
jgi:hypothetical protein